MRVALSWSGGKDAALALHELRESSDHQVVELVTTVSIATDRTTMHGVRRDLTRAQADAAGLPLRIVELPDDSHEAYDDRMAAAMADLAAAGVDAVAFADLLLEDVRAYREERMAQTDLEPLFPLWGHDTGAVAGAVLEAGIRATLVCVEPDLADLACREYDRDLLADLPEGVDPCGENGEFHTFVHTAPSFDERVAVESAGTVTREVDGRPFRYCDLRPA